MIYISDNDGTQTMDFGPKSVKILPKSQNQKRLKIKSS